jgi:hypothetical protein
VQLDWYVQLEKARGLLRALVLVPRSSALLPSGTELRSLFL